MATTVCSGGQWQTSCIIMNRKRKVRWEVVQDAIPQKTHHQGSTFSSEVPFLKVSITSQNNSTSWGLSRDIQIQTMTPYPLFRKIMTKEIVHTCSLLTHFNEKIFYEDGLNQQMYNTCMQRATGSLLLKGKKEKQI